MSNGYLKDPTKHNVESTTLHKYHALKDGAKSIAHCNENIHLDLDTEMPLSEIGTYQVCSKCKARLSV